MVVIIFGDMSILYFYIIYKIIYLDQLNITALVNTMEKIMLMDTLEDSQSNSIILKQKKK